MSDTRELDLLTPDTGLKEDFDGEIYEAEWVQGQSGRWSLQVKILADDEEEVKVILGAGKDWKSVDGGESVVGPSARARFHRNTGYWRWIEAAMDVGAREEMVKRNKEYDGAGPRFGKYWRFMRFHFDVVAVPSGKQDALGNWQDNDENGKPYTRDVILPMRYLGLSGPEEEAPKAAPQPSTSPARTRSTSSKAATGLTPEVEGELRAMAKSAGSYEDWAEVAFEKFHENKDVLKKLGSEEYYEYLKKGGSE